MSMDRKAIEDAIATWVLATASVPADDPEDPAVVVPVRWKNQSGGYGIGEDAYPFCGLTVTTHSGGGVRAERIVDLDMERPAGQEVRITYRRPVTVRVAVEAIQHQDQVLGNASAMAILQRVRGGLDLASVTAGLNAAGLGLAAVGELRDLTALFVVAFESRAHMEVEFNAFDSSVEYKGYIGRNTVTAPAFGSLSPAEITTVEDEAP
jgi:hypothetical protein